jgi:hypothetical protein
VDRTKIVTDGGAQADFPTQGGFQVFMVINNIMPACLGFLGFHDQIGQNIKNDRVRFLPAFGDDAVQIINEFIVRLGIIQTLQD